MIDELDSKNVNLETQTEEIIKIIKLDIEYYPKPKSYSDDYYKDKEIDLKESVTRLFPKKKNIVWKPCREILGKKQCSYIT
jgi:hypothetical protein